LFNTRSYCNVTHVLDDFSNGFGLLCKQVVDTFEKGKSSILQSETYRTASKKVDVVTSPYRQYLDRHKIYVAVTTSIGPRIQHMYQTVEPFLSSAQERYLTHVHPFVEEAIIPVYVQHLQPTIIQVADRVEIAQSNLSKFWNQKYISVVHSYRNSCRLVLKTLKDFQLQRDLNIPERLINGVSESCRNPRFSVNAIVTSTVLILAITFRHFLTNVLLACLFLPFEIIFYFCPWMIPGDDEDDENDEEEETSAPPGDEMMKKNGRL
jgi:hypothetical protein